MLFLAGSRFVWLVVVWRVRVVGRRITLFRRVRVGLTSSTTAPFCVGRVTARPDDRETRQIDREVGVSGIPSASRGRDVLNKSPVDQFWSCRRPNCD